MPTIKVSNEIWKKLEWNRQNLLETRLKERDTTDTNISRLDATYNDVIFELYLLLDNITNDIKAYMSGHESEIATPEGDFFKLRLLFSMLYGREAKTK